MAEITSFQDIITKTKDLESRYSELHKNFEEVDKIFLLTDEDLPNNTSKKTISPNGRNAVLGATRLLSTSEPEFSVPFDEGDFEAKKVSETVEPICKALLSASGKIAQMPLHFAIFDSAVLYGEFQVAIHRTEDLLAQAKGGSKAQLLRMERLVKQTPIYFEAMDPKAGYPEYDRFGLKSYYRKTEMYSGDVLDAWGERALAVLGSDDRAQLVQYCDYLDDLIHVAWIDGNSTPLTEDKDFEHGLGRIPVVCQITEGSSIYAKPEQRQTPFLYTLIKSGLWKRQNLSLTVIYDLVFKMGKTPVVVYEGPDDDFTPDWSTDGAVWRMTRGNVHMLDKRQILDPSLMQGWEIADQLGTESTIYKQSLGQPLGGGNAPYSAVALLNSAGRQALISPKERCELGLANVMETALSIIRDTGGGNLMGKDKVIKVKSSDIPKDLVLKCSVEVDLPQDQLQAANAAQALWGKMPNRWIRENLLKAGQSNALDREIWTEQASEMMYKQYLAQQLQAQQMQAQQAQMGAMPQQVAGQMGQGQPPMPQGRPVPAANIPMRGLPPGMAGMQPPNGELPPESEGME